MTRAQARQPLHASQPSPASPSAPRLDGRRAHVLDRAAEYVRLADEGHTAAQIARRRRKSAGHVSILLRLGRALSSVPEDERAALRSPRVTWRLVQRLVRVDVDAASLRKQLRDAVGGFSTHNVDGRRRRARRAPDVDGAAPPIGPSAAPGVAWGWDATWFARDPAGYAAAHLAHLSHVHQVVAGRAERAVRLRAAEAAVGLDAGQSLRSLQRGLRRAADPRFSAGAAPSAAEQEALAAFAALGRALRDAEAAVAALGAGPPDAGRAGVTSAELADDLEEDLNGRS